ncbi:MAG: hypothetical protein M3342_23155 [Bacteroidota bacterium]|nr:hypothetical protein [Flavisolibacter sp.]MDQ3846885.1 hypothetical protein [Bacteroidota bacterium]MBD0288380.1 hypothetical protein [Flavisolibacter sp.]MBD0296026.1 hypothetical protein [Flavisolibacter sp.]MBD0352455.1 hypothetical protein [Flavisolibacter sp.]
MKTNRLLIGIASTLAIGIVILVFTTRHNRVQRRLESVADAGYETAYDILYPLKNRRFRRLDG